jgi:positive regulator of sigma E activity
MDLLISRVKDCCDLNPCGTDALDELFGLRTINHMWTTTDLEGGADDRGP